MNDFNWNFILTIVALIISVITPAITNRQNNKYQLKMKKIEVLYQQKFSAFQSFCSFFQEGIKDENLTAYEQFCSACHIIKMFYQDEELIGYIDQLVYLSGERKNQNERYRIFNECLKILNKDLEDLKSLFD